MTLRFFVDVFGQRKFFGALGSLYKTNLCLSIDVNWTKSTTTNLDFLLVCRYLLVSNTFIGK